MADQPGPSLPSRGDRGVILLIRDLLPLLALALVGALVFAAIRVAQGLPTRRRLLRDRDELARALREVRAEVRAGAHVGDPSCIAALKVITAHQQTLDRADPSGDDL